MKILDVKTRGDQINHLVHLQGILDSEGDAHIKLLQLMLENKLWWFKLTIFIYRHMYTFKTRKDVFISQVLMLHQTNHTGLKSSQVVEIH